MTYLTHFNDNHYSAIKQIMPQLEQTPKGQHCEIATGGPKQAQNIKFILYSWFKYNNLTSKYKIKTDSDGTLRILVRDTFDNLKISIPDQISASFVQDYLIETLDEDEALTICEEQGVEPIDRVNIIKEWRRVQGL